MFDLQTREKSYRSLKVPVEIDIDEFQNIKFPHFVKTKAVSQNIIQYGIALLKTMFLVSRTVSEVFEYHSRLL